MIKPNILSLCDGLSTGQVALHKAGIEYGYYVASEIDKYAIKAAQHNFPATIQIGDIKNVSIAKIPFKIDLILSGTPCTSFSGAGKMDGFDADSGQLFFQFCRILKEAKAVNPDVKFLFENVASMKKEVKAIITTMLGVEPVKIDSALVCAQTRNRYYWTNIEGITQPEDRGLVLHDILEDEVDEKYYLSQEAIEYMCRDRNGKPRWEYHDNPINGKASTLVASMYKGIPYGVEQPHYKGVRQINTAKQFGDQPRHQNRKYDSDYTAPSLTSSKSHQIAVARINKSQDGKVFAVSGKSQCLSAGHGNVPKVAYGAAIRGRYADDGTTFQRIELNGSSKSTALTTVEKDNVVAIEDDYELIIRKLTEVEVCRLQGLPSSYFYKNGVQIISSTQVFKSVGNGWQSDTVAHILSFYKATL